MKFATGLARSSCFPTPIQSLSVAPSPSSRPITSFTLGNRWTEYQGVKNWDGLLNPLDPVLRSEILRNGEFVQAAYTSFDCDPSSPTYATCRFPNHSLLPYSDLPSTGYRVTRGLHASTGARMPRWARGISPTWMSCRSSWIGYVAVCQDDDEIERLGRRDIVIALRGTVTFLEWLENLRANLTRLPTAAAASGCNSDPMVENGFWNLFTSPGASYQSLRDEVREEVRRLMDVYGGYSDKPLSITITGHSLGAALAVLTAYDITTSLKNTPMVTVMSFGGPRVGNSSFRRCLEEQGSKVLRIVNTQDIITKVPGFVVDQELEEDNKEGKIPRWLLAKTGWVYTDIGQELRVRGRRTANMAACHDLDVYLKLVNQLSASCPFRSTVEEGLRWPFGAQQATPTGQ